MNIKNSVKNYLLRSLFTLLCLCTSSSALKAQDVIYIHSKQVENILLKEENFDLDSNWQQAVTLVGQAKAKHADYSKLTFFGEDVYNLLDRQKAEIAKLYDISKLTGKAVKVYSAMIWHRDELDEKSGSSKNTLNKCLDTKVIEQTICADDHECLDDAVCYLIAQQFSLTSFIDRYSFHTSDFLEKPRFIIQLVGVNDSNENEIIDQLTTETIQYLDIEKSDVGGKKLEIYNKIKNFKPKNLKKKKKKKNVSKKGKKGKSKKPKKKRSKGRSKDDITPSSKQLIVLDCATLPQTSTVGKLVNVGCATAKFGGKVALAPVKLAWKLIPCKKLLFTATMLFIVWTYYPTEVEYYLRMLPVELTAFFRSIFMSLYEGVSVAFCGFSNPSDFVNDKPFKDFICDGYKDLSGDAYMLCTDGFSDGIVNKKGLADKLIEIFRTDGKDVFDKKMYDLWLDNGKFFTWKNGSMIAYFSSYAGKLCDRLGYIGKIFKWFA